MRTGFLLGAALIGLFGGCQACSDCTDYAPPAAFTAPGEVYAGGVLPSGPPVAPRGISPPAPPDQDPLPSTPDPASDSPLARRR